jgi:nucleoside-diphosphate-sugar epimerase
MTVRWITERIGTSPWQEQLASGSIGIVDVRLLRDGVGNSPNLIREKIAEALNYMKRGDRVVICCDHGISRSNAIAAAALAEDADMTLSEALRRVIHSTGEAGIKIDFVDDMRKALGVSRSPVSSPRAFVMGLDDFIGSRINSIINPSWTSVKKSQSRDQVLIDNPVLLDAAIDEATADRVLFCWHPPALDTNRSAGQLIGSLRNVLEVCRVRRIGLIFLSGYQVFAGHDGRGPVSFSEADATQPAGAAGDGLFLCESLIKQYETRHGLSTLVVRSSHVYGPGDERPGILNTLVRKALTQQDIVTHHYQNGAPFIDLIHVTDLAQALRLAIEKNLTGVLHVASGNPIATDELARLITRKASSSGKVTSIEMPGNYCMVRLESTIARTFLKWQPVIDLETGLSEIIDHTRTSCH